MKLFFAIALILLNFNCILAQEPLSVQIVNNKTKQPVSDARLDLIETKQIGISNNQGIYKFNEIKPGNYHLKITHISYMDTILLISIQAQIKYPILINLEERVKLLDEINITAMRQEKPTEDIPERIDIISEKELNDFPNTNIDNYLQAIPNVFVNRSWGIFSKNSSVTMRGMDGTSRVLVLLNGIPLNLSAGGGINWHLVESGQLERIEVIKGPASALYGNNAMGGVINMITKKDNNHLHTDVSIFGGTYHTYGGKINIGNNFIKNEKGFYWSANSFYRQGDGYIIAPKTERDSTDTRLGLKEYSLNLSTGYQFNQNQKIDISAQFYDDKRDEGIKIYEKDGSYLKYTTRQYMGSYTGNIGTLNVFLKTFYNRQDYFEQVERLNETGDTYKLYDRLQLSEDYGFWLNMVKKLSAINELSFGTDFKRGKMHAKDIYLSSTDYFERGGNINFYAVFVQNESKLLAEKLILQLGIRADLAAFRNGYLNVEDPTSVTAFEGQLSQNFDQTKWRNLSPKIAAQFKLTNKLRSYLSFSTGFMPPKLDDMVSSRKINKGFKIANPYLKPETLFNYEIGIDYKPYQSIKFQTSIYYSLGYDFQYFAHTGDTVDIDRPVLIRDNVSKAKIYGIESAVDWKILKNLRLKANYTFNQSLIVEFNSRTNDPQDDITNNFIAETPPHQAYLGLFFTNKIVDINLVSNYISKMWADEYNTDEIDAYATIDLRIQKQIKQFNIQLDIQNILDNQYIDKKNGLSPGRFIIFEISHQFSKNI